MHNCFAVCLREISSTMHFLNGSARIQHNRTWANLDIENAGCACSTTKKELQPNPTYDAMFNEEE